MHQARLVLEFAFEIHGTCKAVPGFDAEKRRALWLRPDTELTKSLPGNLDLRTAPGRVADRVACRSIHNDRVVVKQPLRQREPVAANRSRFRRSPQQAILQPPDRRRLS